MGDVNQAGPKVGRKRGGCLICIIALVAAWLCIEGSINYMRRQPAIHRAAMEGDLKGVEKMLNGGVAVDEVGAEGLTPLFFAKSGEMAKLLIGRGANVNAVSGARATPQHFAAHRAVPEVVELLIEKGADVGACDGDGQMPLHWATHMFSKDPDAGEWHAVSRIGSEQDVLETVKLLVKHGADVNAKAGSAKETPLYFASSWHAGAVKVLLEAGADAKVSTSDGYTPLHEARDLGIAKMLLERGADPNAPGYFKETPLHYAVKSGHVDVVRVLVEHGADVNAKDREGQVPLAVLPKGPEMTQETAEIRKILVERAEKR